MSTLESSIVGGAAAKDYQVETGFLTTLPLSADMCWCRQRKRFAITTSWPLGCVRH